MNAMKPTAVVADPDPAARAEVAGLVARLGCDVVEATTGDEALEVVERKTAIVVLDVALAGGSAYECCRALRERHGEGLPIVLVSEHRVDPSDEVAGLLLGADEYLAKPLHADIFSARLRRLLLRVQPREIRRSPLTLREDEVLALLARGVAAAEISSLLHITPKTTATHIEHILAKMGAHSRAEAVAFALRDRLVNPAA
jgi:two-component system nitrate/nitrite response regulator NarL